MRFFLDCLRCRLAFRDSIISHIFNHKKYEFFGVVGGRKNHGLSRFQTVGLWVVFLETDCKINAKNTPHTPPKHLQLPTYFSTTKSPSKTPPFPHLSTDPTTSQIPNRQTPNQSPLCYRLQKIHPLPHHHGAITPQRRNIFLPKHPHFAPLLPTPNAKTHISPSPSKSLLPSIKMPRGYFKLPRNRVLVSRY